MSANPHARRRAFALPLLLAALALATCISMLVRAGLAQAAAVPKKCPTAAAIESAAGTKLERTESATADGQLVCAYNTSKYGAVTLSAGSAKGATVSTFDQVVSLTAKKAPLKKVSGLGQAAVEFTQNDAKMSADGIATTAVFVFLNGSEFDVIGDLPAKNILAIAKLEVG